jgi:peptide/nickel transport system permease protein
MPGSTQGSVTRSLDPLFSDLLIKGKMSASTLAGKESLIRRYSRIIWQFVKDKPLGGASAFIFLLVFIIAIIGPWITPHDPASTNVMMRTSPPSWEHWMGTDHLGRDLFSRLIAGTQISVVISLTASILGCSLGALLGIVSGYIGGRVDFIIQRITDMIMAFPMLVLIIAFVAVFENNIRNLIIIISFPMIPSINRVTRSVAISVREESFVEAAKAIGASRVRIILRHILPNAVAAYLIVLTSALGGVVLVESSLSFLGLGVPAPFPSWGRTIKDAQGFYMAAPWLVIFPGIAISLIVFSSNLLGDALRDKLDPRLKKM